MLDIRYIREHPGEVKNSIERRGLKMDVDKLLGLDKQRVELQQKSEDLRAKLKLDGKLAFAHTLNGTAVTSSRTIIALLENHRAKDGTIKIPPALQKYYGSNNL